MKIIRGIYRKKCFWGILERDEVRVLKNAPFAKIAYTGERLSFARVRLAAPTVPSKIVLVGLNYRDHARELGMDIPKNPILFLKPATALIAHGEVIQYPQGVARLDYEAELAVVIKKTAHCITPQEAPRYLLGYTCLNDGTARDIQKVDIQWTRAKSFDTFCPLGPWIETDFDPACARIRACLNGIAQQDSSTAEFIFSVPRLVSFVSNVMTLMPGDVISTGTPKGVGPMEAGDTIEISIEGIGTLRNRVSRERR
jgi:2-keto-4-pentenoate hydratase/2-oxohepta-3-ene-1,7-dioic acid hydratase in catechol pathway